MVDPALIERRRSSLLWFSLSLGFFIIAGAINLFYPQNLPENHGPTLRVAVAQIPENLLDPYKMINGADAPVLSSLYDTLIRTDQNGAPVSWLAETWSEDTDGVWTVTLRDDVVFANNEPMTAQHVADVFRYLHSPRARIYPYMASLAARVETVVAPDSRTVIITPVEGVARAEVVEALSRIAIISQQQLVQIAFAAQTVTFGGSGPFMPVNKGLKDGALLVHERFGSWRPTRVGHLVFRPYNHYSDFVNRVDLVLSPGPVDDAAVFGVTIHRRQDVTVLSESYLDAVDTFLNTLDFGLLIVDEDARTEEKKVRRAVI